MLFIVVKTIYVLLNLIIGIYDFSFYRIPNILLGALLVLYGLSAPFYLDFGSLSTSLIVFAVVLSVGLALYAVKIIGAGDAKYLAVISLWVGFPGVIQLLFYTALIGGVIAVLYLVSRDYIARLSDVIWKQFQSLESHVPLLQKIWIGSGEGPEKGQREMVDTRMVPYGIAIAGGAIVMLFLHP